MGGGAEEVASGFTCVQMAFVSLATHHMLLTPALHGLGDLRPELTQRAQVGFQTSLVEAQLLPRGARMWGSPWGLSRQRSPVTSPGGRCRPTVGGMHLFFGAEQPPCKVYRGPAPVHGFVSAAETPGKRRMQGYPGEYARSKVLGAACGVQEDSLLKEAPAWAVGLRLLSAIAGS